MSKDNCIIYMIYREVKERCGLRTANCHYQTAHKTLAGARLQIASWLSRQNFPHAMIITWEDSPPLYIAYHNGNRSEYYITTDILRD